MLGRVVGNFVLPEAGLLFSFELAFSFCDPTRAKAAADVGSKNEHNKTMVTIVRNTTNGRSSILALLLIAFE